MNSCRPPKPRDQLVAGRQEQVERVAEHHVVAERRPTSRASSAFTTAFVASGTNAGVRTSPWASCSEPGAGARAGVAGADLERASSVAQDLEIRGAPAGRGPRASPSASSSLGASKCARKRSRTPSRCVRARLAEQLPAPVVGEHGERAAARRTRRRRARAARRARAGRRAGSGRTAAEQHGVGEVAHAHRRSSGAPARLMQHLVGGQRQPVRRRRSSASSAFTSARARAAGRARRAAPPALSSWIAVSRHATPSGRAA